MNISRKFMFKRSLIFSLILLLPVFLKAQGEGRIEVLDANAFEAKTTHIKGALLDVRTSKEFSEGHLQGAQNVDWDGKEFSDEVKKLPLNQPVFVYCGGGYRSDEASKWMQEKGFKNVIVLKDGYDHWKELGKKVVIPPKATTPDDK